MTYNDPTVCHSGQCDECCGTVRDNEQSLFPWGLKSVCADCLDTLIAEEEAEAEEAVGETDVADRWLFVASDIALAPFGGRV